MFLIFTALGGNSKKQRDLMESLIINLTNSLLYSLLSVEIRIAFGMA